MLGVVATASSKHRTLKANQCVTVTQWHKYHMTTNMWDLTETGNWENQYSSAKEQISPSGCDQRWACHFEKGCEAFLQPWLLQTNCTFVCSTTVLLAKFDKSLEWCQGIERVSNQSWMFWFFMMHSAMKRSHRALIENHLEMQLSVVSKSSHMKNSWMVFITCVKFTHMFALTKVTKHNAFGTLLPWNTEKI